MPIHLPDWTIKQAKENAEKYGGTLTITNNMEEAYRDADVVIPKNWGSWVTNQGNEVVDDLLELYKTWKCTEEMMKLANKDVMYMHALPADRGNEKIQLLMVLIQLFMMKQKIDYIRQKRL